MCVLGNTRTAIKQKILCSNNNKFSISHSVNLFRAAVPKGSHHRLSESHQKCSSFVCLAFFILDSPPAAVCCRQLAALIYRTFIGFLWLFVSFLDEKINNAFNVR